MIVNEFVQLLRARSTFQHQSLTNWVKVETSGLIVTILWVPIVADNFGKVSLRLSYPRLVGKLLPNDHLMLR